MVRMGVANRIIHCIFRRLQIPARVFDDFRFQVAGRGCGVSSVHSVTLRAITVISAGQVEISEVCRATTTCDRSPRDR